MAWSKLEDTFQDDAKFRQLSAVLGFPKEIGVERGMTLAQGHVARLWSWASRHAPDGILPRRGCDEGDVERVCGWPSARGRLYRGLVEVGFIDESTDDRGTVREIHRFWERAESHKAAQRKRKEREAKEAVTRQSQPDTIQVTEPSRLEEREDREEREEREDRDDKAAPAGTAQPEGNLLADHQSAKIDPRSVAKVWEAYTEARSKTPKPAPLMIGGMDRTHIQRLLVWLGGDEAETCDVVRAWVTMDNANKTWSGNGWPLAWLTDPNNSATFERARTKAVELRAEREKRAARQAEIAKLNAS